MTREIVEKASLLEALENIKNEEQSDYYDIGYNVGVEDFIRVIIDMYEPKLIITRLEYELLKYWKDKGYKYIARDRGFSLYIYKEEPSKKEDIWGSLHGHKIVDEADLFEFVEWTDKYPFNIEELLNTSEVVESD